MCFISKVQGEGEKGIQNSQKELRIGIAHAPSMKGVSDVSDRSGVVLAIMQMILQASRQHRPHNRMVLIFRQISVFLKGGKTNQITTIAKRMTNVCLASKEERSFFFCFCFVFLHGDSFVLK